jgi:hypothetical protein
MKDFLKRVRKTSGCWLWKRGLNRDGYGRFGYKEDMQYKRELAHRVSYKLFVGPIPKGLLVLHTCDNAACVRPDHLYAGTQADNINDCVLRNRIGGFCRMNKTGAANPRAKLNWGKVKQIRAATSNLKQFEKLFDISSSTITDIRSRRSWKG